MTNVIPMATASDNKVLDQFVVEHDQRHGDRMLRAVYAFLGRFIAYPSEHAQVAHALWCVHAHRMDAWDSTPRLAFLSAEAASGKTRALEITELLVPFPVLAVNVTPAYLFRKVGSDDGRPTILYDEIDTVFGPKAKDNEEIRGLLNAGHRRGQKTGRCVMRGKTVELEEIEAYSAVALAGLGWLPDTILSRSVIIRMRRRAPGEQVEPFRRRLHAVEGDRVRAQVEAWAAGQADQIEWPDLPPEIQDRNADLWEPLIAVADLAGGDWPKRARAAAVALVSVARDAEPSLGVRLLEDLRAVFDAEGKPAHMRSSAILKALQDIEEAPWRDQKGKPLDERGLARRLREYGVKSKVVRIGDGTPRGYARADLLDAWSRYLPPSSIRSETSETPQHSMSVAGVAHVTQFQGNGAGQRRDVTDASDNVADVADAPVATRQCEQCGLDDGQQHPLTIGQQLVSLHKLCVPFWTGERGDPADGAVVDRQREPERECPAVGSAVR